MQRWLGKIVTTAMVMALVGGCGGRSYEARLNFTLADMKYRKRLDDNLMPPTKEKLEPIQIFLRPPKSLEPLKLFFLTELEPGKFDLSQSYAEKDKQNLHVLARVKLPKDPTKKKAAAPADAPIRGEFLADIVTILNAVYNVELDPTKAREETRKANKFKRLAFEGNGKSIQAFFYGSKNTPFEVALIFEYPKTEQAALSTKIELCLGSFAVGEAARLAFSGNLTEDGSADPGTGATSTPVAF